MRRILVVILFIALVVPVSGQITQHKSRLGWNSWGGNGNLFFNPGSFRHHAGFFPILPFGRERASALFLSGFLFSDYRPTTIGYSNGFRFDGYPYFSPYSYNSYNSYYPYSYPYGMQFFGYQGFEPRPALYNSAGFVEEWQDRDPTAGGGSESQHSALRQSILLKEGMDEDQVVRAIGSPVQRVQLGERTVWKYSGYSLLFESGKLREIR
jgi:hypothetical protein